MGEASHGGLEALRKHLWITEGCSTGLWGRHKHPMRFLMDAICPVGMRLLLRAAYHGRLNAPNVCRDCVALCYQVMSNRESEKNNSDEVRSKLEVQSCCEILNFRLSF